jgi:hypothetical protein
VPVATGTIRSGASPGAIANEAAAAVELVAAMAMAARVISRVVLMAFQSGDMWNIMTRGTLACSEVK